MNLSHAAIYPGGADPETETDSLLVARIADGDADAARVLVDRYTPALRRFITQAGTGAADVDDVLQETWLRVVRSSGRFDPLQPFRPWLFAIAMNRVRSRWKRERHLAIDSAPELSSTAATADEELESAQRAGEIRALVRSLPRHLADTILLRFFEDLTEAETAERLGVPKGTVKSRVHHGLRKLRSELERISHG